MQETIFSLGLNSIAITLLVVQVVSLLIMLILVLEYRHIHRNRMQILHALGTEISVPMMHRTILIIVYIVFTLLIAGVSSYLYVFQPHLL